MMSCGYSSVCFTHYDVIRRTEAAAGPAGSSHEQRRSSGPENINGFFSLNVSETSRSFMLLTDVIQMFHH